MANATGVANATVDTWDADAYACEDLWLASLVYFFFLFPWLCATVLWNGSVFYWGKEYTLEIHRTLVWIPTVELIHGGLSALHYLFCPWTLPTEKIVGAGWVVAAILKQPIMLVCLLLVAKGWCITRTRLETKEVLAMAMVVSAVYASVIVQMSLPRPIGIFALLLTLPLMLLYVLSSSLTNMRILKAQLLALRRLRIDATTTPAYVKYRMFGSLFVYATLYFLLSASLSIAHSISPHEPWILALLSQLLELAAVCAIGTVFRPRPFNVLFEQAHQLAAVLAEELLPGISTVTIDVAELRGDGDTEPWFPSLEAPTTSASAAADASSKAKAARSRAVGSASRMRGDGRSTGEGAPPPDLLMVVNPGNHPLQASTTAAEVTDRRLVVAMREAGHGQSSSTASPETRRWDEAGADEPRDALGTMGVADTTVPEPIPMASIFEVLRWSEWRAAWAARFQSSDLPRTRWRSAQVAPAPPGLAPLS